VLVYPAKPSSPQVIPKKSKYAVKDKTGDISAADNVPPKLHSNSSQSQHTSLASFGPATRSPSRRSAAAKAGEKLRDNAEDMNHFRKEMTNGKVRGQWEKGAAPDSLVVKHRT